MNNIKWILFDMGGVILQFMMTKPEGYTVGTRFFDAKVLEGFFFTKDYISYTLGTISHEQFITRCIKKFKLDLSVEEFDEIFKKDVTVRPGMEDLFKKLSQKYKIALATNEGKVFTKYKVEGSGLMDYLSKIIPSYLLREMKPSVQFYKKTLEIVNAKPEECIFIDDTKENCEVAKSLGITSIQFQNVKQLEEDLIKLQII